MLSFNSQVYLTYAEHLLRYIWHLGANLLEMFLI